MSNNLSYRRLTTPEELLHYCLRKLGGGIHNIEITDDQCRDRLSDALQYFREFNLESVKQYWIACNPTAEDEANGYLTLPEDVLDVLEVLQHGSLAGTAAIDNIDAADFMFWQTLWGPTVGSSIFSAGTTGIYGGGLITFETSMSWIDCVKKITSPVTQFLFQQREQKLYLTSKKIRANRPVYLEVNRMVDLESESNIFDSIWLKKYLTVLLKEQWYQNLTKYQGVKLVGGLAINEQKLAEVVNEKERLEEEMKNRAEEPPFFYFG